MKTTCAFIVLLICLQCGLSGCRINRYNVVRHADRAPDKADTLTEAGLTRAKMPGNLLLIKGSDTFSSTPLNRTWLTVLPLSEYIDVPVIKYEYGIAALPALVDELKRRRKSLVCHSDTILPTLQLFGVTPTSVHCCESQRVGPRSATGKFTFKVLLPNDPAIRS